MARLAPSLTPQGRGRLLPAPAGQACEPIGLERPAPAGRLFSSSSSSRFVPGLGLVQQQPLCAVTEREKGEVQAEGFLLLRRSLWLPARPRENVLGELCRKVS